MKRDAGFEARIAFTVNSATIFREEVDIVPTIVDDTLSYVPWGGDNQMPFDLLALVKKDETLTTCQCFNAEVCYGSGLQYCTAEASASVRSAVEDFLLENDIAAYFLGICQDFKHFGFAVSVLILNEDGNRIVRLLRKDACYCRFTPVALPQRHDLDLFDHNYSQGITAPRLRELGQLGWLEQNYNILLMGPSGTGKTFIASGLVYEAVRQGYKTYLVTMKDVISTIKMKSLATSAMTAYNCLLKADLVAIDDIMLFPVQKEDAAGLFNLINTLYEKASLIITTDKAPTEWAKTLDDEVLASVILEGFSIIAR